MVHINVTCSQMLPSINLDVTCSQMLPGIHLVHKCYPLYTEPRRFRHCSLDDHRRHVIWMMMVKTFDDGDDHGDDGEFRITCQYTGHCCMLPLSLHKRKVVGQWQQHLGTVCSSGEKTLKVPSRKILSKCFYSAFWLS